jgi:hypothetical protein
MQLGPRFRSLIFGFGCFAANAFAQSLVCSTEMAAGMSFNRTTKTWSAGTFRPEAKYVVVKSDNNAFKFEVRRFGAKTAVAWCESDFSEHGLLQCKGLFQEFSFSRADLRFLHVYSAGYWNESSINRISPTRKEGEDTPAVAVGTCASL